MEQLLPKEMVTSLLMCSCHNLDVFKLMAFRICVFKQLLVQPFSTIHLGVK